MAASRSKGEFFFSVGTIGRSTREGRKPSTLLGAARHNQRAIQAEQGGRSHIDPARGHLNETIAGPDTPEAVVALALSLMTAAGVAVDKLRKDHTQAVELLFSLPSDTTINTGDYFRRCVAWAGERFGAANILSADIHRDEAAPHCHILILPLVGGRMRGSGLIARPELAALRNSFSQAVARIFGLKEPPSRMSGAAHGKAVRLVLARLESSQDAILRSGLWSTVRRDIERDPARFIAALGIEFETNKPATNKPARTMAQIFTSTGKGGKIDRPMKPIGFDGLPEDSPKTPMSRGSLKPIGFASEPGKRAQKHRNLSCVGFGQKRDVPTTTKHGEVHPPLTPPAAPAGQMDRMRHGLVGTGDLDGLSDPPGGESISVTRERDGDNITSQWSDTLGEFPSWPPAPALNPPMNNMPDKHGEIAAPAPVTLHPLETGNTRDMPPSPAEAGLVCVDDAPMTTRTRGKVQVQMGDNLAGMGSSAQPGSIEVPNGRRLVARHSGHGQENMTDHEQDATTRERDSDHEAGLWCEALGAFVTTPGIRTLQRTVLASIDALVGAGLVTRGWIGDDSSAKR